MVVILRVIYCVFNDKNSVKSVSPCTYLLISYRSLVEAITFKFVSRDRVLPQLVMIVITIYSNDCVGNNVLIKKLQDVVKNNSTQDTN